MAHQINLSRRRILAGAATAGALALASFPAQADAKLSPAARLISDCRGLLHEIDHISQRIDEAEAAEHRHPLELAALKASEHAEAIRKARSKHYFTIVRGAAPEFADAKDMLSKRYAGADEESLNLATSMVVLCLRPGERKNDIEETVNADPEVVAACAQADRAKKAFDEYQARNPRLVDALYEENDELAEMFGDRAAELALTPAASPLEILQKAEILAIVLEDSDVSAADFFDRIRFDIEAMTGDRYLPLPQSAKMKRNYRPEGHSRPAA